MELRPSLGDRAGDAGVGLEIPQVGSRWGQGGARRDPGVLREQGVTGPGNPGWRLLGMLGRIR